MLSAELRQGSSHYPCGVHAPSASGAAAGAAARAVTGWLVSPLCGLECYRIDLTQICSQSLRSGLRLTRPLSRAQEVSATSRISDASGRLRQV